jgi:integrase
VSVLADVTPDGLLYTRPGLEVSVSASCASRALLLLGFALGLRRAELVGVGVEDLSLPPITTV